MANRTYMTFNYPQATTGGKTLLTGIRKIKNSHRVYISGFYDYPNSTQVASFVYSGYLNGKGIWNELYYPSSQGITVLTTNLYGPNNGIRKDTINVVGNYTTQEAGDSTIGCLYQGPLSGSGIWTTLIPTSSSPVLNTIAHSTMGQLVVGNYNTQDGQSKAFIYDILTQTYYDIIKPNAITVTAYGIWHNKHNSYTICGGFSNDNHISGVDTGYLVDWDNKYHRFSNWRDYSYNNLSARAVITHFNGITSDGKGGYNLTGDWSGIEDNTPQLGFFANVQRNKHGRFNRKAKWEPVSFPGLTTLTSGNSVYKKIVIGVYTVLNDDSINGYISFP